MKTTIVFLVWVLAGNYLAAQNRITPDYLTHLPKDLQLNNSRRSYVMTTEYMDFNIQGDFLRKSQLVGTITYGLPGDSVQWQDVCYSVAGTIDAPYSKGDKKEFMEQFTYYPDEYTLTSQFFAENIPEANPYIMNMIWDALGFDVFAYCCWDELSLNKEYRAQKVNSEMDIAGIGTFENRDIRITWLGITEMNNEICAILKYSVMNNPLKLAYQDFTMTGRSHYWGEVYVSLSDKQIEYVTLAEDVITDVKTEDPSNDFLGYTIRTISLIKVK